jgi:hypothetical protein
MQPETNSWLDVISDAWEEAYTHSATVEQLLYELDLTPDSAVEKIARINEATVQYSNAMDRYKKASGELRSVLAERLN